MAQTMMKGAFHNEKTDVLGELAIRLKNTNVGAGSDTNYPPPPPVFQTYAKQLSGDSRDHETTSEARPQPQPQIQSPVGKKEPRSQGELHVPGPKLVLSKPELTSPSVTAPTRYSHKRCKGCQQPVISGGGYANGKLYHQECFKCSDCNKKLDTKFSSAQGRFLCRDCYKNYEKCCQVCSKTINQNCVESNGKFYHQSCMKCNECHGLLTGQYFILMGKFLCEEDYKKLKKTCAVCEEVINGVYYSGQDKRILCETHYKKLLGNCARCGDTLGGSIMKIEGAKYHSACFTCNICSVSLRDGPVLTDEKRDIYCQSCHDKRFALKCAKCQLPIVPDQNETSVQRLRALNKDFHPACFSCDTCGLVLEEGCFPIGNKPFCYDCYEDRRGI